MIALGRSELDLTRVSDIRQTVRELEPDVIVNAAAYTAVDRAEAESDLAYAVNARAPRVLAECSREIGALLVHYSTDYVFDGEKDEPYTEEDAPAPLNVYGSSKLEGERAVRDVDGRHLIVRTSWVYGSRGSNFLLTMLRLAEGNDEIRVVDDQVGSPTSSRFVAEATAEMLVGLENVDEPTATYHLACRGETTWYRLARAILELGCPSATSRLVPIRTLERGTKARRPMYSALSSEKLERNLAISPVPVELALEETMGRLLAPNENG